MHTASSYWFIAERHNQTDEVLRTYDPAERFDKQFTRVSEETAFRPHQDSQPPEGNP